MHGLGVPAPLENSPSPFPKTRPCQAQRIFWKRVFPTGAIYDILYLSQFGRHLKPTVLSATPVATLVTAPGLPGVPPCRGVGVWLQLYSIPHLIRLPLGFMADNHVVPLCVCNYAERQVQFRSRRSTGEGHHRRGDDAAAGRGHPTAPQRLFLYAHRA